MSLHLYTLLLSWGVAVWGCAAVASWLNSRLVLAGAAVIWVAGIVTAVAGVMP